MRKSILLILFTLSILLSRDNYKEIKIFNENIDNVSYLHSLGIHIDHIYKAKDYIQFVINELEIEELEINQKISKSWTPNINAEKRNNYLDNWTKAVEKSKNWI